MDTVAASGLIVTSLMGSAGSRTRLTVKVSNCSKTPSLVIVMSTGTTRVFSSKASSLVNEPKSAPAEEKEFST